MKLILHAAQYINPAAIKLIRVDHVIYEPGSFESFAEILLFDGGRLRESCKNYEAAEERVKQLAKELREL